MLNILFEDQDIIICHKPSGTPTQSSRIGCPDTISMLKNHLYKNSTSKQPPYLAVIHRLDQPVEGLLVFAKTPVSAKILNKQLIENGFGKYYRAILDGIPDCKEGTLENYLIKDGKNNISSICSADTPGSKKARLHYKIIESILPYSLAEITLETGRHHQIRVQMANMGTPVAGDQKYGSTKSKNTSPCISHNSLVFQTLQLVACKLTFRHPRTNKFMEFNLDSLTSLKNLP
jgi:23S rRNA pseudouridine1911/1915/1917 synthase